MFLFTTLTQPSTDGGVRLALREASARTGTSFDYLLNTAQRESNFDSTAQARGSSARGMFQFIESTWLATVRDAGAALGYADYAEKISTDGSGRPTVADAATKQEILKLRDDPQAAALMAGALAQQNSETLQAQLGRAPRAGELYLAHFLGAQGAVDLISLAAKTPGASAAASFPAAAQANRTIFYDSDGSARSAADVYSRLTSLGIGSAESKPANSETGGSGLFAARTDPGQPFHNLFSDTSRGMGPIAAAVASMWRKTDEEVAGRTFPGSGESVPEPTQVPVTAGASPDRRSAAATSPLLVSDGKPLDIRPDVLDGALRSYARSGNGLADRIMR